MNNLKDIHNTFPNMVAQGRLFYQDVNEQFEGYTQPAVSPVVQHISCFIRMSMNNLKDIHNLTLYRLTPKRLFYQDVNEQFEGYTQLCSWARYWETVVLSGCQWTIWRIYTTISAIARFSLCCFIRISMNNLSAKVQKTYEICKFIWKYFVISKKNTTFAPTNLKDIHNKDYSVV